MTRWGNIGAVLVYFGAVLAGWAASPNEDYVADLRARRAERLERLTRADGWLTLVGLHFLAVGKNSIGSGTDNAIVLPKGPAHLGVVTLAVDGTASIALNPGADARVDGREVLGAKLSGEGERPPAQVTCDTLSLLLIERGGRKALRVRDSAAPRRADFAGLEYFPIDPSWRIEARWVEYQRPREVMIANTLGQESPALIPGKAVFERDGRTFELLPLVEGVDEPLLFVISDQTSGKETYEAARFIYADPPENGKLTLDFNMAVNPPCAFTPFATCPLPPKENRLPVAVSVGEKKYAGHVD